MKQKRRLILFIMILTVACIQWMPASAVSAAELNLQAQAALVMDAQTGEILYEKDIHTKREPASTTKIVTCMLALEHLDPEQQITIPHDGSPMGSNIGIKKGEKFTVEELLYALMLPSANDAAVALAEEIGGTVENFCKMMDEKAAACGAKSTHFLNPNGLNWKGQEAHLTTAYDLAVITRSAMQDKRFRKLTGTAKYTIPATNKSKARKLENTNKCLWDTTPVKMDDGTGNKVKFVPKYEGTVGVKTGLTSTAGGCLVNAVRRNGAELISVVLHSGTEGRYYDTIQLNDYVLENFYDTKTVVKKGETVGSVRVKQGALRNVGAVAASDAAFSVRKGQEAAKTQIKLEKKELQAPVVKGQVIGTAKVYADGKLISKTKVLAAETVQEGGPLSYFGIPDWMAIMLYIAVGLLILILAIIRILKNGAGSARHRRHRAAQRQRRRRKQQK